MSLSISPKCLILLSFISVEANSAELLAAAAGSAASSTVMGYVKDQASVAKSYVENPKTFDNEYNEAVCGLNRDKMRKCINGALLEIDLQAQKTHNSFQRDDIDERFSTTVFVELGKSAQQIIRKHQIAMLSLDFIEYCKELLFGQIDQLKSSLRVPHSSRFLGTERAHTFDQDRQSRVDKAVNMLTIWKNNLLGALHEKYPYTCEGGLKDRFVRSSSRHHERARDWRLEADWFGNVAIPPLDLQAVAPFSEADKNPEAVVLHELYPLYSLTFSFLRETLAVQVDDRNPQYLSNIGAQYGALAPTFKSSTVDLNHSEILEAYTSYLQKSQE